MPNWCNNSISITGPADKIMALMPEKGSEIGLLGRMRPEPEYPEESDNHMPNWWNWRVANWGTKWDIDAEGLEVDGVDGRATITGWFDSAWSPPIDAVKFYCEQNPEVDLYLTYNEPGMGFVGRWEHTQDGVFDEYYEYSDCSSDEVRDYIGETLDDEWGISETMAQYEEMDSDLEIGNDVETLGSGMTDEGEDEPTTNLN